VRKIPRLIELKKRDQVTASIMAVFNINSDLNKYDAIAVFAGQNERERITHGIDLWKSKTGVFLLITDINQKEKEKFGGYGRKDILKLCGLDQSDYIIVAKRKGENTLEQVEWVSAFLAKREMKSLVVVTAPYHLPRTVLTIIKVFQRNKQQIQMMTSTPNMPSTYNFIPGEIKRIRKYQKRGDIAGFKGIQLYY